MNTREFAEGIMNSLLPSIKLISTPVAALPFEGQVSKIMDWASRRESRSVCLANVHMLMEGHRHSEFGQVLARADLVAPDGMPLVWLMKALGIIGQDRVAGMDVFLKLCELAADKGVKVFFLGSQSSILEPIQERLPQDFPNLDVVGMRPLPMMSDTPEFDAESVRAVNESGASLVFISLGCPKQERWMDVHRDALHATMIGVGGVFPIYAGLKLQAPDWVRNNGLEWLYRWSQEPKRLAKRYLSTNPAFVFCAFKQVLISKIASFGSRRVVRDDRRVVRDEVLWHHSRSSGE